jgi:hypothetical protein
MLHCAGTVNEDGSQYDLPDLYPPFQKNSAPFSQPASVLSNRISAEKAVNGCAYLPAASLAGNSFM